MSLNLHQRQKPEIVKKIVVLLHGYGADGQDLLSLGEAWEAGLPNTLFVAPDAPTRCEMNPSGYQWFGLSTMSPAEIMAGVESATKHVVALLTDLVNEHNVNYNDIALVGFSQGAMLSLYTALTMERQLAGVVAYSGALPWAGKTMNSKPPMILVHGEADPVVPVSGSIEAHTLLKKHGVEATLHTIPGLPHGIDPDGMRYGGEFLVKQLTA